jgi:hypothetical protein
MAADHWRMTGDPMGGPDLPRGLRAGRLPEMARSRSFRRGPGGSGRPRVPRRGQAPPDRRGHGRASFAGGTLEAGQMLMLLCGSHGDAGKAAYPRGVDRKIGDARANSRT